MTDPHLTPAHATRLDLIELYATAGDVLPLSFTSDLLREGISPESMKETNYE